MQLDPEGFRNHLQGFERSAWRWESQPVYSIPNEQEAVRAFLAGKPRPEGHNAGWHKFVRDTVASGRTIGRVRAVRRPLPDYVHYQLAWGIPANVEAGEDIRILDLTDDDYGLPRQDYWIFDESTVVQLNFNPDGTLNNLVQLEDADVTQYLQWRDTALRHAVTYSAYVARAQRQ